MLMRRCWKMTAGLFPLLFLLTARALAAQETNGQSLPVETVITNMAELWTLPPEEKNQPHRIRMELLIYYCDPDWNVFWGRSDGLDTFLPFRGHPSAAQVRRKNIH